MALLTWSGTLSIGIGVFDREHQELLDCINELQAAVDADMSRSVTTPLLQKLANATQAHFLSEESMMTASKYPGLMLHSMKHRYLLEQLNAFLARYGRESSKMNEHSLNFLRDWVVTHIQNEDFSFALWLNEQGKK
jgi:hemerythrin